MASIMFLTPSLSHVSKGRMHLSTAVPLLSVKPWDAPICCSRNICNRPSSKTRKLKCCKRLKKRSQKQKNGQGSAEKLPAPNSSIPLNNKQKIYRIQVYSVCVCQKTCNIGVIWSEVFSIIVATLLSLISTSSPNQPATCEKDSLIQCFFPKTFLWISDDLWFVFIYPPSEFQLGSHSSMMKSKYLPKLHHL